LKARKFAKSICKTSCRLKRGLLPVEDLAELNRRLSATGWFNSVVVAPEFDKSRKTKVLPLHGVVSPRTENTIETGGYSTDVGPRVKATWKNRG
jgi:translocation and assembly module TamA